MCSPASPPPRSGAPASSGIVSDTVPHFRLLLADVAPAVRDGSTSIAWQVWNDGDAPVVIRGASAPDPQFFAPATGAALEIGARVSERLEVRFVLGRREIGADFHGARLIVDVDVSGTRWRIVATMEGRFGPGGVVLPRTTELHVERAIG